MEDEEKKSAFKPFDANTWWKNTYDNSPLNRLIRQVDAATWVVLGVFVLQLACLAVIALYTRRVYISLLHSGIWIR